ncbi:hypothetical protein CHLRE_05g244850v5 [Chlamydomonas reinhardtii]|uniref:Uncharacterized protein n=1 Tax=Chlamydomonas reinhardtii TaxID=3055 RepID=A8I5E8_CHLRE|nr:uncharacterized protein CHLRE_05g244850v5 [Chlamydomonas reinhardtii]PNW83396.1 hypothetical protein CHLRE_05g244850v5 [Chlamydomonas reinhardtii]|eukprot:XP_001700745.1 ran-binding protein Mog1 [Chlamydomonas reinhardtii]
MAISGSLQSTETRELWGGAVTCSLPARMLDVSDMRPVPDHQEIWADTGVDQAVIFEIVEHDAAVPDGEAGRHMFEDAAVGNEAVAAAVESVAALGVQDVPGVPEASYRCVVRGRQTMRRGQQAADTCVLLAVLRLPHVSSDLLITLSTPSAPQTPVAGAVVSAPALGEGEQQELMAAVLRSLRVQSWELFG